jgi:hypothetical protein
VHRFGVVLREPQIGADDPLTLGWIGLRGSKRAGGLAPTVTLLVAAYKPTAGLGSATNALGALNRYPRAVNVQRAGAVAKNIGRNCALHWLAGQNPWLERWL